MSYELTEPHFDDERTLLSARRVVPLEIVETQTRQRRRWLTATITVAATLGTLAASFAYYKRAFLTDSPHFAQNARIAVSATIEEPQFEFDIDNVAEGAMLSDSSSDSGQAETIKVTRPVTRNRARAGSLPAVDSKADGVSTSSDDAVAEEENERPVSRRIDRWEERRERRTDRRNRNGGPSDLFRIDQIFEGAPKP